MFRVVLALAVACCTSGLAQEKPKKAPPINLVTDGYKTGDFVYRKTPQGELTMHVHYPEDWKNTDRRPVIVFFFGGGWNSGSYLQFVPQAQYLASRGMVACCADYRIKSLHKTTPDQCVVDAKSAIRWVRANADKLGIDPQKVVASGGSAGGHLAAATALVPGFDAAEDDAKISPIPNALILYNPALNLKDHPAKNAEGKAIGADISPTLFLHAKTPPTILYFGTDDKLSEQGKEYVEKATGLGFKAEMYLADGQAHGFFNRAPWLQVTTIRTDEFLQSLGYLTGSARLQMPSDAKPLRK